MENQITEKNKFITFFHEVYDEMTTKVTWPSWKELWDSTVVVLISIGIISLVVFLMDFIFGYNSNENAFYRGLLYYIYSIFN